MSYSFYTCIIAICIIINIHLFGGFLLIKQSFIFHWNKEIFSNNRYVIFFRYLTFYDIFFAKQKVMKVCILYVFTAYLLVLTHMNRQLNASSSNFC